MHRLFAIAFLSLLVTGCGATTQIVLHHPETKHTHTCQGDPKLHSSPAKAAETCAKGYEKAGYVRMSSY
jgi:hypothetical protein